MAPLFLFDVRVCFFWLPPTEKKIGDLGSRPIEEAQMVPQLVASNANHRVLTQTAGARDGRGRQERQEREERHTKAHTKATTRKEMNT